MSTNGVGTFDHYQRNGNWVRKPITTRRVFDRITTPTARTKYTGEGICLGAWVTGHGRLRPYSPSVGVNAGQVWAQSDYGPRYWWVTDGRYFYLMHESGMEVTGQAQDEALFDVA